MKHIFKLLASLFAVLAFHLSVEAYDLVVTVTNPSLVTFMINYSSQTLNEGETRFENLTGYNYVSVFTTDGGVITKIVQNGETIENPTFVEMNLNDDYGISTFTLDITAVSQDDLPKSQFKVNVDNPSRTVLALEPKWKEVTGLVAGENTVDYIPALHTYCALSAPYGEAPIYKVESTDGTPHQYSDGTWEFDIKEGMTVTILADYPDETVPVTFNFTGDGRGCISSIAINSEEVENFDPENFNVKLGSKLTFTLNTEDYTVNDFAFNNDHPYLGYTNVYSAYVTGPTTVMADAVKNQMVNITVNINIGEGVTLYKGLYTGDGYPTIKLADGKNTVEVNASAPYLSLVAADGFIIDRVTLNGANVAFDTDCNKYPLTVREGDEVEITVTQIVRDQKIALYIDNYDKWSNFNMVVGQSSVRDLHSGYNVLEYNIEELAEIGIYASSWYYDTSNAQLYVNDTLQTPLYEGNFQFDIRDLKDGDVIKTYFDGAPARCEVAFEIPEGVELSDVCHDLVAYFDPVEGLECFEGTAISFRSESEVNVFVNDVELSKDKDGAYNFVADGNTLVKIIDAAGSIDTVDSESAGTRVIYNLHGVPVQSSDRLPAGLYIINGKKIYIP